MGGDGGDGSNKFTLGRRISEELLRPDPHRLQRRMSNDGVDLGDQAAAPAKPTSDISKVAAKFCMTGLAAMTAEGATFPIDITKTRMQLHGEGVAAGQVGFFRAGGIIVRGEGIAGLYKGMTPAIARHIPYTGIRVGLYEHLRATLTTEGEKPSFLLRLAMGFSAGGTAQAVAVPMDLIKIRMQADGRLVAAGQKPRYSGLFDALRKISAQEGVKGLWKGSVPAVTRAALVNLGELATYDTAKQAWLESGLVQDNVYCHVLSAVVSGFFASLASTPADVVKTRLMNESGKYSGMVDCFVKTAKTEGIRGLYKGFLPGWGRLGPWQLVFWVSYEQLRKAGGHGSF